MLAAVVGYFRTVFHKPRVQKKTLETLCVFFTEAAVLVAVFPVLDTILANHGASQAGAGAQQGAARNIWTVAIWSEGIALVCLLAAVIIGITIEKGD